MAPVDPKKRKTLHKHLQKLADLLSHIDEEVARQVRTLDSWLTEDTDLGLSSLRAALGDALNHRPAASGPVAAVRNVDSVQKFFEEFTYEQGSERCWLTQAEVRNATTVARSIKEREAAESTVTNFLKEYDAEPGSFWGKFHGNRECDRILQISDALEHFSSRSGDIARRVLSRGLHDAVQDEVKRLKQFGRGQPDRGQSYRDLALKNVYARSKRIPAPRQIAAAEKWSALEPGVMIGITIANWTIWDRQISLPAVHAVNAYLESTGSMAQYRKATYLVEKIQLAFGSRKRKSAEPNDPEHSNSRSRISPGSSQINLKDSHSSLEFRSGASKASEYRHTAEKVPGISIDQAVNGHQNAGPSSITADITPNNSSQTHLQTCTQGSQHGQEDPPTTHVRVPRSSFLGSCRQRYNHSGRPGDCGNIAHSYSLSNGARFDASNFNMRANRFSDPMFPSTDAADAWAGTDSQQNLQQSFPERFPPFAPQYGWSGAWASTGIRQGLPQSSSELVPEFIPQYGGSGAWAATDNQQNLPHSSSELFPPFTPQYGESDAWAAADSQQQHQSHVNQPYCSVAR